MLFPGDQIYIPDLVPSEFQRPTDLLHKFSVHLDKLKLCLVLEDLYERPIATAECSLQIGFDVFTVTTDDTGRLELEIAPDTVDALVTIKAPQSPFQGTQIPIKIGYLDPVRTQIRCWQNGSHRPA